MAEWLAYTIYFGSHWQNECVSNCINKSTCNSCQISPGKKADFLPPRDRQTACREQKAVGLNTTDSSLHPLPLTPEEWACALGFHCLLFYKDIFPGKTKTLPTWMYESNWELPRIIPKKKALFFFLTNWLHSKDIKAWAVMLHSQQCSDFFPTRPMHNKCLFITLTMTASENQQSTGISKVKLRI